MYCDKGFTTIGVQCAYEITKECKERVEVALKEIKKLNIFELILKEKPQADMLRRIADVTRLAVLNNEFSDTYIETLFLHTFRNIRLIRPLIFL